MNSFLHTTTIGVEVHPLDFFTDCGKSVSTAGTQLGKRNLEVLEMDISEYSMNLV